jgi:hypothetical protein
MFICDGVVAITSGELDAIASVNFGGAHSNGKVRPVTHEGERKFADYDGVLSSRHDLKAVNSRR